MPWICRHLLDTLSYFQEDENHKYIPFLETKKEFQRTLFILFAITHIADSPPPPLLDKASFKIKQISDQEPEFLGISSLIFPTSDTLKKSANRFLLQVKTVIQKMITMIHDHIVIPTVKQIDILTL